MGISLVQTAKGAGSNNGSVSATFTNALTTGDEVLALISGEDLNVSVSSVTGAGATWSRLASSNNSNGSQEAWLGTNASSSGSKTITATWNNSSVTSAMQVSEWSGLGALDVDNMTGSGSTSPASTNTITTTNANDLLIGWLYEGTIGDTVTDQQGFTKLGNEWDSSFMSNFSFYKIVTTIQTNVKDSWTYGGGAYNAFILAIKGSSGTTQTQSFSASLSFTGQTPALLVIPTLAASLSFAGGNPSQAQTQLTGALSFTGFLMGQLAQMFTAGLSFLGSLATVFVGPVPQLLQGTLSFTGKLIINAPFRWWAGRQSSNWPYPYPGTGGPKDGYANPGWPPPGRT